MKKIFLFLIVFLCCSAFEVKAQSKTEVEEQTKVDSLAIDLLYSLFGIYDNISIDVPRYKIYPTENMYISLKLDTATGRMWMVQIGLGGGYAMTMELNNESLILDTEIQRPGRFELYPTQNIYNFVLLDTQEGNTFQVQWHINADKRFVNIIR